VSTPAWAGQSTWAAQPGESGWAGQWVHDRLGVQVHGSAVRDLVGLALRRNPKRAHLLVSEVLGKHIPTEPRLIRAAGLRLGELAAAELGAGAAGATVLGYAETATGLGHLVAEAVDAEVYLHSTRRRVPGLTPAAGFAEDHSHASEHLLLPADPRMLTGSGPLVLVDDELSTGRTVANTLRALHRLSPHRRQYVVAALVDVRAAQDHLLLGALSAELGAKVTVVALASGTVRTPPEVLTAGAALVEEFAAATPPAPGPGRPQRVKLGWPDGLPDGGRHGVRREHRAAFELALPAMAQRLSNALTTVDTRQAQRQVAQPTVAVLGFEELMYTPLRLADALADLRPDLRVRSCTTTRSPVLALDADGYAVRHRIVFPAHDDPADGTGPRFAYNLAPGRFDAVVAVVDDVADTPALAGLTDQLATLTPRVLLAVLPSWTPGRRP